MDDSLPDYDNPLESSLAVSRLSDPDTDDKSAVSPEGNLSGLSLSNEAPNPITTGLSLSDEAPDPITTAQDYLNRS